jgi:hypothetical protein
MKKSKVEENEQYEKLMKASVKKLMRALNSPKMISIEYDKPKKYSETLYEFIKPAIYEFSKDNESLIKILHWGKIVWNKAVAEKFPNDPRSIEFDENLIGFNLLFYRNNLFAEYLKRKKELFDDEDYFIKMLSTELLESTREIKINVEVSHVREMS